jgi:hypothetical protein
VERAIFPKFVRRMKAVQQCGSLTEPWVLRSWRPSKELERITKMSKVFSALAVSVDGYITGRDPGPGRGLGDGGTLFDWYFDGDVPSKVFDGFKLSEPSARVFDALAGRVGAVVAERNTYDDSEEFGGTGPHPTAPLFVLSHRAAPATTGAVRTLRLLMIVLNATIVNVYPPSIREHLGYSRTRVAVGCAGSRP